MKIEHKLSDDAAAYVKTVVQQLEAGRNEYLKMLGQAKEIENACNSQRAALQGYLGLVEQNARLPRSITPYQLSADGTKLIGETAEPVPAGPVEVKKSPELSEGLAEVVRVNGHASEEPHA